MQTDAVNLLAPSTSVMLSTIGVFLCAFVLVAYMLIRVWRAVGATARLAAPSTSDIAHREQIDVLTSRVQELEDAQRFVETLVSDRTANVDTTARRVAPDNR
ncbi:MAG: hypothetical protein IT353_24115 [Gemmatimonadaceae bacterium]|nr:hypothetical protein [Gemmatimonadaceae bacterium]